MTTKLLTLISALLVTVSLGCKKPLIGQWSDIIQLSGKEFNFNPNGDSVLITAKGKWWGINSVTLDTSIINVYSSTTDACNFIYIDNNIKIVSKSCDTLVIKMNANNINTDRTLNIGLWAGDYNDEIKIIQRKK